MSKVYKTKPPCITCEKYKKWKEEDYVEKPSEYFKIRGKSKIRFYC